MAQEYKEIDLLDSQKDRILSAEIRGIVAEETKAEARQRHERLAEEIGCSVGQVAAVAAYARYRATQTLSSLKLRGIMKSDDVVVAWDYNTSDSLDDPAYRMATIVQWFSGKLGRYLSLSETKAIIDGYQMRMAAHRGGNSVVNKATDEPMTVADNGSTTTDIGSNATSIQEVLTDEPIESPEQKVRILEVEPQELEGILEVDPKEEGQPANNELSPDQYYYSIELNGDTSETEDEIESLIEFPRKGGEFVEYYNETKNIWREAWGNYLISRMKPEEIAKARVLCFPGIEGHEADMYIRRGFKPENLVCVEGGSNEARRLFIDAMKQRGIAPRTGRLRQIIADEDPFDVVSLDLLGPFSREISASARRIKLKSNKKVYASINWMEGRENKFNQETLKHGLLKQINVMNGRIKPDDQVFNYDEVDLREARQWTGFHLMRTMGRDVIDNWLEPDLVLKLPIEPETKDGLYKEKDKEDRRIAETYITLMYGLDMIADSIGRAIGQYNEGQGKHFFSCIHNGACGAILNRPILLDINHFKYKSKAKGGRIFLSDFAELTYPQNLYQQTRRTMHFLLEILDDALTLKEESGAIVFRDKKRFDIDVKRPICPSDVMYYEGSKSGFSSSIDFRRFQNDFRALMNAEINTIDYRLSTGQHKIIRIELG